MTGPLRLFSLFGPWHTVLLYAREERPFDVARYERAADAAVSAAHGLMNVYLIAAPGADVAATVLPLIRDTGGEFAGAYSPPVNRCTSCGPTATWDLRAPTPMSTAWLPTYARHSPAGVASPQSGVAGCTRTGELSVGDF